MFFRENKNQSKQETLYDCSPYYNIDEWFQSNRQWLVVLLRQFKDKNKLTLDRKIKKRSQRGLAIAFWTMEHQINILSVNLKTYIEKSIEISHNIEKYWQLCTI